MHAECSGAEERETREHSPGKVEGNEGRPRKPSFVTSKWSFVTSKWIHQLQWHSSTCWRTEVSPEMAYASAKLSAVSSQAMRCRLQLWQQRKPLNGNPCSMHLLRGARRISVLCTAPAMPIQNATPARKQHQQAAAPGRTTLRALAPCTTLPVPCCPQVVLLRKPAQGSFPSAAGSAAHSSPAPQDNMRWEQLIVTGASALTTVLLARKLKQRRGSDTASAGGAATAALQRDMRFWTPSEALAPGLSDARAVVTLKPSHGQQQRASSEGMQFASVALVACIALLSGAAGGMVLAGHDNTAAPPWHARHAWQPSSLSILAAVALTSFFLGVMCASVSAESAGENGEKAGLPGMAGGAQADTTPQPPPACINPELSGTWVKVRQQRHMEDMG